MVHNKLNFIYSIDVEPGKGSGKTGTDTRPPGPGLDDTQNQVVNEEEQHRTVNQTDGYFNEDDATVNEDADTGGKGTVTPGKEKDIETPGNTEGDNLNIKEGKIPLN